MMMLWILCLLIGSMTCSPVNKLATSFTSQPIPPFPGHWGGSDVGSSSPLSDTASEVPASEDVVYAGPGSYSGSTNMAVADTGFYHSPAASEYGAVHAAPHTGSYGAPGGHYGGHYGFAAPQDEDLSAGSATDSAAEETPEPIFSDVSNLEPVYSYSSRSAYQQGRLRFAQTRYTPGEPVPPMPLSRRVSKTSRPSSPVKAPAKEVY
ncbi:uncharacterized protein LOC108902264 [Lates calcarifer]|uniref:Uncharacterized protein LOC108902264 n=1 Tax=Lates calcarifer TaxID=8187 RepID=A0AAJ7VL56_LATCA|nr:uncharacterized protein LOC108902264 [Lates calcarifer]XP_050929604.1 uncharacterized protein LOC108902264 [Lates calcarifer]